MPNFTEIGLDMKCRSRNVFTTLDKVALSLYNHHKTRASFNTFWNETPREIPRTIDESLFGKQNV